MPDSLKIIIPMAGLATRMRPHTWSKPKPLISVAGRTTLEHLLDMFNSVPDPSTVEFVFILSPYLGESQIPAFLAEKHPTLQAHYVIQAEMKGQSHALWLAREYLRGQVIICFSDTLLETDFSFIKTEKADAVAWVKAVPDPRRFGVAQVTPEGWVSRFVEKPKTMENNLAVVGCYYFKEASALLAAIGEQMKSGVLLKNEYFLADAITIMIERGARIRTQTTRAWLDTGTIEATLDTNRVLLEKSGAERKPTDDQKPGVTIHGPVSIHPTVHMENSVIGPYVSIGSGCRIRNSTITDSILEADCMITDVRLDRSLVGRQTIIQGCGNAQVFRLNVGDDSSVFVGSAPPE